MTKRLLVILPTFLMIISAGLAYSFYTQLADLKNNPQNQNQAQAEVKDMVARVSQLILLPTGEDPTLATVVDPDKLKDQPFFANAQKGDKVLIYTNARKAILYNPTTNKIVDVAPISIGNGTSAPTPPPAPSSSTSKTN